MEVLFQIGKKQGLFGNESRKTTEIYMSILEISFKNFKNPIDDRDI